MNKTELIAAIAAQPYNPQNGHSHFQIPNFLFEDNSSRISSYWRSRSIFIIWFKKSRKYKSDNNRQGITAMYL